MSNYYSKMSRKGRKKPSISLGVAPPGKMISEHSVGIFCNFVFGFILMNQHTVKLVSSKAQRAESSHFLFAKYLALLQQQKGSRV